MPLRYHDVLSYKLTNSWVNFIWPSYFAKVFIVFIVLYSNMDLYRKSKPFSTSWQMVLWLNFTFGLVKCLDSYWNQWSSFCDLRALCYSNLLVYANKFRVFEINKKKVQTNINFYLSRRNGYNLCEFITKKINSPLIRSP